MKSISELLDTFETYYKKQKWEEKYDVYEASKYIMDMNGKRIRPLLTMLSSQMFGADIKMSLPIALAVEIFHNCTLVHDDIMDKANKRRGLPTVHKKYSQNIAINTGDLMFALSYKYLNQTKKDNIVELNNIFNDTIVKVIEGQSLDMKYENIDIVSESEYLEMIKGKTSVLLACALKMGAWVANASPKNQKLIYDFGLNLGLSFQIQDDYLDAFGDNKKVGKKIGGDILLNKKTILQIKTNEFSNTNQKAALLKLKNEKDKSKKINGIKKLMEETGAKKYTENLIENYYKKSIKNLSSIEISDGRKMPLLEMAKYLKERDK
jgi:geranylgeranyl diphosphate synthase type II